MAKNIKTAQKTSKKIGTKVSKVTEVKKRDGTVVPFDESKITNAVLKAMKAVAEGGEKEATKVAAAVTTLISNTKKEQGKDYLPTVEEIQDLVEKELILQKYSSTAKAYILYREKRAEIRKQKGEVPREVKNLVTESKKYFRNQLSEFVYYTTYSRWIPEKGRRETWMETVDRYVNFMRDNLGGKLTKKEYDEIRHNMLSMRAMGSMRLLWAAGKAAAATHVCAYNCSYIAPTDWRDFGEIMYVLMCGTGCGYSVEHQNVEQLPIIQRQTGEKLKTHVIKDSKEGWADAFVLGLRTWAAGKDIAFDYSEIRPQGARLKTMGGRASGPEPLRNLIDFSRAKMLTRQGRRLTTLDVHDIICKTGEVVVMGGVRRSALISLSDLDDQEMKEAKNGQFYISHPERMMANNSVVYNEKPTIAEFLDEWLNLIKAQSGERGTFNRGSLEKQLPARRWPIFKKDAQYSGLNPCGEIVLKSKQFCNLSEVVARREDTLADLADKVRVATILGTYQSTLTKFGYLSPEWRKNCEEERLLGVSITGQWDCPALRNPEAMKKLQKVAVETNK
ncbi:MAG TPA: ATP cone domain-containing protein, partial [Candidatus Paceibacterota bacterium]|nr:ATP cone domain-containing protein [Candidatus Paceibacterota bacterium]HQI26113.1 ATP cone domain-containing protein [Candidatus Paceibacterota bacterium]